QGIERIDADDSVHSRAALFRMFANSMDAHPQRAGATSNLRPDMTQSDEQHHCPMDLARTRLLGPDLFLRPYLLALIPDGGVESLGEHHHQRDGMLGYHRTVYLAGVGHHHFALLQSGEHQLVDGSGGRMDPQKTLRDPELFRADRPAKEDIAVFQVNGNG